jgi:hypothetical protein
MIYNRPNLWIKDFLTGIYLHETLLINTLPNNLIYETNKTNCLNK